MLERIRKFMGQERRKSPRVQGDFAIEVFMPDGMDSPEESRVAGRALDVSREGLRIRVSHKAEVGAKLSLAVYVHERDSVCLARVIWKAEGDKDTIYGLKIESWSYLDSDLESEFRRLEVKKKRMHLDSFLFQPTHV